MKAATLVARILLGLVFFVFGLNGFLNFMPMPPMPEKAMQFAGALAATGYMFPFIKIVEVVTGALLLAGVFVPLALTLLGPVLINILFFHIFLTPPNEWGMGIVLVLLHVFLMYSYRQSFAGVFAMRPAN
jgi:uncharacterized membrane protein YphA (DoxX/SURF4 family)